MPDEVAVDTCPPARLLFRFVQRHDAQSIQLSAIEKQRTVCGDLKAEQRAIEFDGGDIEPWRVAQYLQQIRFQPRQQAFGHGQRGIPQAASWRSRRIT